MQHLAQDLVSEMTTVHRASLLPQANATLSSYLTLTDGTTLLKPRFADKSSVVFDLEEVDGWVQVVKGFPYDQLELHQRSAETRTLKLLLAVPETTMTELMRYDSMVRADAMTHPSHIDACEDLFPEMDDEREPNMNMICNWLPLDMGNEMVVYVTMEASDAPTQLVFVEDDGTVTQGHGFEFWRAQVGDTPLHDFLCQARLELQFVDVDKERKTLKLIVKANCLKMARRPKARIVACTDDEVEAFVRAVKRIRVNRV